MDYIFKEKVAFKDDFMWRFEELGAFWLHCLQLLMSVHNLMKFGWVVVDWQDKIVVK